MYQCDVQYIHRDIFMYVYIYIYIFINVSMFLYIVYNMFQVPNLFPTPCHGHGGVSRDDRRKG